MGLSLTLLQDILSGDEIISDTYKLIDIDDAVYEVDARKVTKGGETFDIGANPSTEEAEEGLDDSTEQVIDIVDSFRLNNFGFADKKDFMTHFKGQ